MLYFFTTLAIEHLPPLEMYCVLIIPALRAIETAFPVLENHVAEIRNETSCALIQAIIPPSTLRFAPVMYEDSGPATTATTAATSSTSPYRSSAVKALCGTAQSPVAGFVSVSIGPGWILLTVMPRLPPPLDNP